MHADTERSLSEWLAPFPLAFTVYVVQVVKELSSSLKQ
jgi:hypothetical protein